jgi:mRNA-degrading endonuclease toxin of MazEF toxin-antitoxin module
LWVNLDPTVGSEQAKTRPVVVMSADSVLERFGSRAGRLDDGTVGAIAAAIALCVDYEG